MRYTHTWEQAVEWLRNQPGKEEFIKACYFDDPIEQAAQRYCQSEEWASVAALLGSRLPGKVLDIGAGRGISSFAFAMSKCEVTALEPYSSKLVGSGAISALFQACGMHIDIVEESGEDMPFEDNSFDIVYCRAALHHADDLYALCAEAYRVLRPGGVFLATREHVLSKNDDLDAFLKAHSLHFLYGGENAYTVADYKKALEAAQLQIERVVGPYDEVFNYAPMTREQLNVRVGKILGRYCGVRMARYLAESEIVFKSVSRYLSWKSEKPGRHYSFLLKKP